MVRQMLILSLVLLTVGACSKNSSRLKIQKSSLTTQGRGTSNSVIDQKLGAITRTGKCLPLKAITDALRASPDEVYSYYSSSVRVGKSGDALNKTYTDSNDKFVIGQAIKTLIPIHEAIIGADLGNEVSGLLVAVSAQDECKTVTFQTAKGNSAAFTVADSTSSTLVLVNDKTGETRRYSQSTNGQLKIVVHSPITLQDSACAPQSLVARQQVILAWGSELSRIELDRVYATALVTDYLKEVPQELTDALAKGSPTVPVVTGKPSDRTQIDTTSSSVFIDHPVFSKLQAAWNSGDLKVTECKKP